MKNLRRIVPFLLCFVLAVSVTVSFAYAADSPAPAAAEEDHTNDGGGTSAGTGMLESTAQLGKALIDGVWSVFGIHVPGFSFTFGQMWVGVLLASVSILVIRMIFGFGGSGPSGVSPRTSSTNHPKISKERRHDEF